MLGSVSIISLIGIIGLAFYGKEIPQALVALGNVPKVFFLPDFNLGTYL
jgi:hypothetical protein